VPGSTEIAEAEIAEATNFLREYFLFTFMATLPATNFAPTAHIIAQPRPDVAAVDIEYFFVQYPSLSTFFLQNSGGTKPVFTVVFRHRKSPRSRPANDKH
jgi:hypothetical protein